MAEEARVALASSPRDWVLRVHRHLADHGGASVRTTALQASDVLREPVDVLVADDTTSFLTLRLVNELHARGVRVLGVHDVDDERGRVELAALDVDEMLPGDASTEQFVATVVALATAARAAAQLTDGRDLETGLAEAITPSGASPLGSRGHVCAVAGASGGVGATEVALGLAWTLAHRGAHPVLVDADELAPSLAQRLGLPLYPNLRAAVDAATRSERDVAAMLRTHGPLPVLCGLSMTPDWAELRPSEVRDVVEILAAFGTHVVVNVASCAEDLSAQGGPPRFGTTRALLEAADQVVGVTLPSPLGVARALEWLATVRTLRHDLPHMVLNRAPRARFRLEEVERELRRSAPVAGVHVLPADERVARAGWEGHAPSTPAPSLARSPGSRPCCFPASPDRSRPRCAAGSGRVGPPDRVLVPGRRWRARPGRAIDRGIAVLHCGTLTTKSGPERGVASTVRRHSAPAGPPRAASHRPRRSPQVERLGLALCASMD